MTGLRREQAVTRRAVRKVELDCEHGDIIKVNPLADWSYDQVWDYIRKNDVPYNRLCDQGYASIGCAPCTRCSQAGRGSPRGPLVVGERGE
jgi:phosphoadenosine phosphosulfate reductase